MSDIVSIVALKLNASTRLRLKSRLSKIEGRVCKCKTNLSSHLSKLLQNNREWAAAIHAEDENFFKNSLLNKCLNTFG